MRKDKALLALMMVLLLAVAAFALRQEHSAARPFALQCTAQGRTESISLWEDDTGDLYAFLPSWADAEATTIHLLTDQQVQVNGVTLTEGMTCAQWPEGEKLLMTFRSFGSDKQCAFQLLRSANLPAMHIDTASGSMAFIHENKTNEESAQLRLYTPAGSLDFAGKIDKIKGRGNNTWEAFEKKPYSLTLAQEANLLGMGAATSWVLLADAGDPSHMRNKLAFDLAKSLDLPYTPDAVWVDVYLNGAYGGVYLLAERNEVHQERVNVDGQSGVLLSMELEERLQMQNIPYLTTEKNQAFRIHFPQDLSRMEKAELSEDWQQVERALLLGGKAWDDLLDLDSWVKIYLVNEVLGNSDANFLSQYFIWIRDEHEKVYAGPVWDFDHSMGQRGAWQRMTAQRFYANQLLAIGEHYTPWFHAAYQDEVFYEHLVQVYVKNLLPALEGLLGGTIETYLAQLVQAVNMDQIRWRLTETLHEEVAYIRQFMDERIAFLNSAWVDGQAYCQVRADQGFGAAYGYYAVPVGQCLEMLPALADTETQTFLGWYDLDSGEPFNAAKPLTQDQVVVAKWRDKPGKTMNTIVKLLPAAFFGAVLLLLLILQMRRIREEG